MWGPHYSILASNYQIYRFINSLLINNIDTFLGECVVSGDQGNHMCDVIESVQELSGEDVVSGDTIVQELGESQVGRLYKSATNIGVSGDPIVHSRNIITKGPQWKCVLTRI